MKLLYLVLIFIVLFAAFYLLGPQPAVVPGTLTAPAPAAAPSKIKVVDSAKTPSPADDKKAAAPAAGGSLKGVVKYDGDAPEPKVIKLVETDQTKCGHDSVVDETLVVDKATKGLKWAMIRIMDASPKDDPPKPATPYQMTQKGCTFTPHVVIVPPNTDLLILNPDKILHNIHSAAFDSDNPGQNPATTTDLTYKAAWLKSPDIMSIECNIHSWMKGYILCHDPRYCAVSAADGTFEIKDLPPGKYKLNVWHEKFGNYLKKETIDIEIKPGAATDLGELKFAPR